MNGEGKQNGSTSELEGTSGVESRINQNCGGKRRYDSQSSSAEMREAANLRAAPGVRAAGLSHRPEVTGRDVQPFLLMIPNDTSSVEENKAT